MARGPLINREPDYVDLDLDFFPNPSTADISMKRGDDAIKRSIRNLILTNYYERPFQPGIGSSVTKLLFDNATPMTAAFVQQAVTTCIRNFEPRVRLNEVIVEIDPDNNGFNVTMKYTILNRESPSVTSLFLERIR